MWVELIFVLTLNKYQKLDVIGIGGKKFLLIPKAFSVEMLLSSAYPFMAK